MFQSSAKRLRTWLKWTDDVLGDPPEDAQRDSYNFHNHPHRRPLRWDRDRRSGAVPSRPAHCISPVRQPSAAGRREPVAR